MTEERGKELLVRAQADEHNAKAWHYRMSAFKEFTIAALVIICTVIIFALATQLWPYLPK